MKSHSWRISHVWTLCSKGPCFSKVWIQSLYSIKERVHAIQRYRYSLFVQLKKGFILFNGINSVSLLNQRKGPCYSKVSIQSLCSIKERVHTIQRYQFSLFAQSKKGSMLFKEFYINKDGCVFNVTFQKRFLYLYLKTSSFFISSTSFFCAIRSMFLKNQSCLDSLLNQRKGPCFLKVSIQSLYSIKERVHAF